MNESPRLDDVDEQRAPPAAYDRDERLPGDPRVQSGAKGVAARYPLWLIVGGVVIVALVLIYIAWIMVPTA